VAATGVQSDLYYKKQLKQRLGPAHQYTYFEADPTHFEADPTLEEEAAVAAGVGLDADGSSAAEDGREPEAAHAGLRPVQQQQQQQQPIKPPSTHIADAIYSTPLLRPDQLDAITAPLEHPRTNYGALTVRVEWKGNRQFVASAGASSDVAAGTMRELRRRLQVCHLSTYRTIGCTYI
jgi:hypothetical protein